MKIVIPISSADLHLLQPTIDVFKTLGLTARHEIVFLPTRSTHENALDAEEQLRFNCKAVRVHTWDKDNTGEWPLPGNLMWQHAVIQLGKEDESGNPSPWYFYELDNCPIGYDAFDKAEAEYALSGCLYMGAVVPTRIQINGQYTTERHIPGAPENIPHMVGTGIYPSFVPKHTQGLWKFPKYDMSWDVYLRYVMNKSLHATQLIDHHWSTINYREKDGQIICDNDPRNPFGTDHSGPVSKDAFIVHGCKDGSLHKLILEKFTKDLPAVSLPVLGKGQESQSSDLAVTGAAAPASPIKKNYKLDRALDSAFKNSNTLSDQITSEVTKRKRGRPRKNPELVTA